MAECTRKCHYCHRYGHIQRECPEIRCFKCNNYGHIARNCQSRYQTPPRPPRRNSSRGRAQPSPPPPPPPPAQTRVRGQAAASACPGTKKNPSKTAADSLFEHYPTLGKKSWLGYSSTAADSCQKCGSRRESGDLPSTILPVKDKDLQSNSRSVESVKRLAETLHKVRGARVDPAPPLQILVDKKFRDFQEERNAGLLTIPETERDLQKGDFDIIMLHPGLGYIHIEVKAFGDAQDHLTEDAKRQALVEVLEKKGLEELQKGRRALEHLQPPDEKVSIINTLGLPNITRDFLTSALQERPDLRQRLAHHITPSAGSAVAVEMLCLCSDDLPPQNGLVDEADSRIKEAIGRWWSDINAIAASRTAPSKEGYRLMLASFFNNEKVKTFSELVQDTGERFQYACLDEQQARLVESEEQYMYITGLPGSGKTFVLAEKAHKWLRQKMLVIVIYSRKSITNQPAAEFLMHSLKSIADKDETCSPSQPHEIDLSQFSDLNEVFTKINRIKDAVNTQDETVPADRLKKNTSDEITAVGIEKLKNVFTPAALDLKAGKEPDETAGKGENICFILDDLHMRTITGSTRKLLKMINKRLPAAKIWCAGSFPFHQPEIFFHMEQLHLPYRCTPKTQRLLQALEPFCQSEKPLIYEYMTSSTGALLRDVTLNPDYQYRLPKDGPDLVFFSHGDHGTGEIYDCVSCVNILTNYLQEDLRIGQKDSSGKGLEESDVLIVVSSTALYNRMGGLVHSELYRRLTSSFRVNIYKVTDTFSLDKPGISLMHARHVAGMEKKVVISIPVKQYQPRQMTYADAVKRSPRSSSSTSSSSSSSSTTTTTTLSSFSSSSTAGQSQTGHSPNSSPGAEGQGQDTRPPNLDQTCPQQQQNHSQQAQALPPLQVQRHTSQTTDLLPPTTQPSHHRHQVSEQTSANSNPQSENTPCQVSDHVDSQCEVRDILQQGQMLTQGQMEKLSRLGKLNLHWLWYSVSRAVAHNVIFHF